MSTYHFNVLMTLMLVTAFLLLELESVKSEDNAERYVRSMLEDKRQPITIRKYCGSQLANALGLLCQGVYNSMFKKSVQEMEANDYAFDEWHPFTSGLRANDVFSRFAGRRFRRDTRGVHDECCLKPCSVEELASYCGERH